MLVTNYETVIMDASFLRIINWKCVVVDEAHRLKNRKSNLYLEMEQWKIDFPLFLSGTPVQNNVDELFSLLHFVDPKTFANFDFLKEQLGELQSAEEIGILHGLMKPYLLRRVKADVEKSLAPKEETLIEVSLTNLQKKYYRAVYEKILGQLIDNKRTGSVALRNVCMQLRQVCNHPFILPGIEQQEIDPNLPHEEAMLKLIKASGKTIFLDKVKIFLMKFLNLLISFSYYLNYLMPNTEY